MQEVTEISSFHLTVYIICLLSFQLWSHRGTGIRGNGVMNKVRPKPHI